MARPLLAVLASGALLLLTGCNCTEPIGCSKDTDCKEDRICTNSVCVPPGNADGGGTDGGQDAGPSLPDGGPLPQTPFIQPDRTRLGFGREFGEGVWVGTQVTETLQVRNLGLVPLVVSAVTLEGADSSRFSVRVSPALSGGTLSIPSLDRAFVQVVYSPTDAGTPVASLKITSNAENQPTLVVPLSAKAVSR